MGVKVLLFVSDSNRCLDFNMVHQFTGAQPKALADSVLAFAKNFESLDALEPALELIAQKHVALNIKREHYPIVGRNLINAMVEVLGKETANTQVTDSWTEAYGFLADALATREEGIYERLRSEEGGWNGKREFVVTQKVGWIESLDTLCRGYME
jgi:nitric oxide dioxygenase